MAKREEELKPIAEALRDAVAGLFESKGGIKFSSPPKIERKDIIEWQGLMRIKGMEKFNATTYIAYVNFYLSEQDKQKKNCLGALILYVEEQRLLNVLMKLGYPKVDDENDEEIAQGCGKFCQDIVSAFKGKLTSMGYPDLIATEPKSYKNNVLQGIEFCFKEYDKLEVNFLLEEKKGLAVEITLGVMPKR